MIRANSYTGVDKKGKNASTTHATEKAAATKLCSRICMIFYCAITFAHGTILIRCIYRIHEMAAGSGNPRMRNEALFLILDGMMIALASLAMTIAYPGFLFPPMQTL